MKNILRVKYSRKVKREENIAVLSNLHICNFTKESSLNKILKNINLIDPNHIAIPGNLFDAKNFDKRTNNLINSFIKSLCDITNVYYVLGNSELNDGNEASKEFTSTLNEKSSNLPYNFYILHGNDDVMFTFKDLYKLRFIGMNLAKSESEKKEELLKEYFLQIKDKLSTTDFNILLSNDETICDYLFYIKDLYGKNIIDLIITSSSGKITKSESWINKNETDILVSNGITKYDSYSLQPRILEHFHEGTIDCVKILKP